MNSMNENEKKLLFVLIIGNLLMAIWSTFVFLVFLSVPIHLWVFLNICAPTQYITILALVFELKGKRFIGWQIAMTIPLFRFGTGGLFVFGWDEYMITAQISHLLMTALALLIIYRIWKLDDSQKKKKVIIGLIIGFVVILMMDLILFPMVFSNPYAMELLESMGFNMGS